LVVKYYANLLGNVGSEYNFQFGGNTPTRTLIPVPAEVLPSSIAEDILVDTSQFNKILSSEDSNVQKALETLDDHGHDSIDVTDNSRTLADIIS
jgi:hypothetical protein